MKQIPPPLCSKCNAEAVLKTGKFGVFYCCQNWPKCEGETISKDDYEKYYKKNHHKKDMVIDAGWIVNYAKPAYNETCQVTFEFKKRR